MSIVPGTFGSLTESALIATRGKPHIGFYPEGTKQTPSTSAAIRIDHAPKGPTAADIKWLKEQGFLSLNEHERSMTYDRARRITEILKNLDNNKAKSLLLSPAREAAPAVTILIITLAFRLGATVPTDTSPESVEATLSILDGIVDKFKSNPEDLKEIMYANYTPIGTRLGSAMSYLANAYTSWTTSPSMTYLRGYPRHSLSDHEIKTKKDHATAILRLINKINRIISKA